MTEDPFLVTGLCLYVAAERFGTRLFPAWLIVLEILLFASLLLVSADGAEASIRGIILGAVIIGAAWVLGIRTQRMRCETERNARAQERLRLARDIHDVLSHTLGGIGVRAGVVAHVKSSTPDDLRSALQGIESDARDALGQLQVLMRQERSETADDAPPGSLPELVRELSQPAIRAGISVVIDADDSAHHLPAAQRTTAYRIIQEALTNVIRHSGAGTCRITIRTEGDDLRISVLDDGPGAALASKNGHGLTGMRERAQLLGGTFEAGRETNGYRVAVSLPGTAGRAHSR
ncbi:sensor histidine kinase [Paenarthrobacter nicotinovorans]|uniref:sensor histidine kinase n=1 Tax=Paenarthrobacter nicotinovorans TaxID=29320 RepID=UPI0039A4BC9F